MFPIKNLRVWGKACDAEPRGTECSQSWSQLRNKQAGVTSMADLPNHSFFSLAFLPLKTVLRPLSFFYNFLSSHVIMWEWEFWLGGLDSRLAVGQNLCVVGWDHQSTTHTVRSQLFIPDFLSSGVGFLMDKKSLSELKCSYVCGPPKMIWL